MEKAILKNKIRELKVVRDGAVENKKPAELKKVRREIRSLKRQLRLAARTKSAEAAAPAEAEAAAPAEAEAAAPAEAAEESGTKTSS